jgi:hypothetical protein
MVHLEIKVGSPFTFEDSDSGFTGFHGRATEAGLVAFGVYVNSSATKSLPLKYSV